MNVFEKIEKIRSDKRLGINDFLEVTGVSKTSYYSLKKGESKGLTPKTINKIINTFPEYEYNWLLENSQIVLNSNSFNDKLESTDEGIENISIFILKHKEEFLKNKIFSSMIDNEILKKLLNASRGEAKLKELIQDLI